jgi:hypothetical protein
MPDEPNVIPFGKHKGKTVEEVQTFDPQYLDWLTSQPWFRDRFVVLHQTIINRGAEPEETPDHNALQALFLDDAFCLRVADIAVGGLRERFEKTRQHHLSLSLGARWIAEDRLRDARYEPRVVGRKFEEHDVDVVFGVESQPLLGETFAIEIKPAVGDDYPAVLRQMRNQQQRLWQRGVLRCQNALFLEHYIGVGATTDQFVRMFVAANICIVFRSQVE